MPQLNAYLSFNGNCAEAMNFYAQVLGAKLEALISFGDMPADAGNGCSDGQATAMPPMSAADAKRIMHAYLVHPEFSLMAGDTPPGMPYAGIQGVMLALSYPTVDEATRVFNALAAGGKVQMPLGETFWAKAFGMVTDRFGTPWGVNGGPKAMG